MDIQKSKELSFDTQDFPKEVWVFDVDNLDQGTEISHLMMSHAEEYTKDELLVICRKAAMVIDQLRTDLAKSQAVQEWISTEDQMPPIDETVLVCWEYTPDIEPEKEYTTIDENLDEYWPNCQDEPPTHWMPLPKVVKAQEPAND